jgi:hypothetical protein
LRGRYPSRVGLQLGEQQTLPTGQRQVGEAGFGPAAIVRVVGAPAKQDGWRTCARKTFSVIGTKTIDALSTRVE